MRPAMMLLLRALVILGAVFAVLSCKSVFAVPLETSDIGESKGSGAPEACNQLTLSNSVGTVPAAGGTISTSGTGFCL